MGCLALAAALTASAIRPGLGEDSGLAAVGVAVAAVALDESRTEARATVGDHVEVRLKAQFGTGYSWALAEPAQGILRPLSETMAPAEASQPGGFETQIFAFEATAPGEARLAFVYRRPWMPDDPSNRRLEFAVTIQGK